MLHKVNLLSVLTEQHQLSSHHVDWKAMRRASVKGVIPLRYLESSLDIICCYVKQALGKLPRCQEQPLFFKSSINFEYI